MIFLWPRIIYLCINKSSAIDVFVDNPNRIEGAFNTTDVVNTFKEIKLK
jgi:hypothetical protein